MSTVQTGLFAGKIPFIRACSGERQAVVFFGGNALFKRLDKLLDPSRYARQIARLMPERFRFTILGYEETRLSTTRSTPSSGILLERFAL